MSDVGLSMTKGVAYVARLGEECSVLSNTIKEAISNLFESPELKGRYVVNGWKPSARKDPGKWLITDVAYSLPVIIRPKRLPTIYVFFQISLLQDGIEAEGNARPLLHVGVWSAPVDFNDQWVGFPFADDCNAEVVDEVLFRWPGGAGAPDEWNYSLYLDQLNSAKDVQAQIVEPLKDLILRGTGASQQIAKLTGVVHYARADQPGFQYRVLAAPVPGQ